MGELSESKGSVKNGSAFSCMIVPEIVDFEN
jgi:hypothetical protein